ncbi:MAG: dTDP-4-dehydrorhamnose 3,5-epimerase family protein [Acidobacteriota bacterium]|nr:dTDP-4-dehydrorhamnose 3,5-epimerase family protein [Acidobacteriota bacterium]MDE3146967.1 dTDP-4-dehydrorhamnose 3,5-epimerase family protein [Acidobacteriota bacterium]
MNLRELEIAGLYVAESRVFADERGFFREWFKSGDFEAAGVRFSAEQSNLSMSVRNVVRGLHYSLAPRGQAKVVTCVYGSLDDVIVDVRVGSPTFGAVVSVALAADEGTTVVLPAGVAHGFCVTSETAALSYLLSTPYDAPRELEIHPLDPEIAVPWRLSGEAILSEKDAAAPSLAARREAGELPTYS